MLERRRNPIGRAATASVPRITLGGLRLAVLDIEQTANFMIGIVFPERCVSRPLYLTSANGEVLARCSTEPMTERLFRAADLINADGQPLVTVSRLRSKPPLPQRVAFQVAVATSDDVQIGIKLANIGDGERVFLFVRTEHVERQPRRRGLARDDMKQIGGRDALGKRR